MMYVKIVPLMVGLYASPAAAAPTAPDLFAHGFEIEFSDEAPLYRLPLTRDVYTASIRADQSDLAVFNAAGTPVPHLLRSPVTAAKVATDNWDPLPIFPVPTGRELSQTDITVQTDGTLIRIAGDAPEPSEQLAYVIDARGLQGRISALELVFAGDGTDMVATVAVDASSSFGTWRPLVASHRIARLEYAGHTLDQSTIPLPLVDMRYYQIRTLDGADFKLAGVNAKIRDANVERTVLPRFAINGEYVAAETTAVLFDLGGHIPIRSIALNLEPNKLFSATLESRAGPDDPWRRRRTGTFYALRRDGLMLRPQALTFPGIDDRYWRLSGFEPAQQAPFGAAMEVSWHPQELLFLAEGSGPYVLAVGRAQGNDDTLSGVPALAGMTDAGVVGEATVGRRMTLGGEARLERERIVPWRQLALWGILLGAVGLSGLMVLRLMRQMRD